MLVANKKNGEKLSLGDSWDKKELTAARAKEKFFCPECNEEVIMKLGSRRIWHFSHQAGSSCQSEFERESEYHLSGKLQLFQWLKKQGINAELERYDSLIRQKPDIAFEWQGKKYAVEFQCSIIPEELFIKRTQRYHEGGYTPIWIAAENLIKRTGTNAVSLSNFLYLFIRRPRKTWNITAFCPLTSQFIELHHLITVSSRKTINTLEIHPLSNYSADDLIFPDKKNIRFLRTWQTELQKYKFRYLTYPGSYHNPFLNELYKNHLNMLLLPPEIGLPVFSNPYIETPPLIWQMYLYLDVFRFFKKGDFFTLSQVESAFFNRVRRQQIKLRKLPAVEKDGHRQAIEQYLHLLVEVAVLAKVNSSGYRMVCQMKIPATHEEQAEAQTLFYKKYDSRIEGAILNPDLFESEDRI